MIGDDNFEIKYWGKELNSFYQEPKTPARNTKQRLLISLSFLTVLAILPMLIFGLSNLKFNKPKIVTNSQIKVVPTTAPQEKKIKQKELEKEAVVVNNDSYWKISKRVCGSGKYYLSIQAQNDSKPLHKGDLVKVNCSL